MAETRKFGGKVYNLWNWTKTEGSAKRLAADLRKQGYLARTAKGSDPSGGVGTVYLIFCRRKR